MKMLTPNQLELLEHIHAARKKADLDFDQLLDLLSWTPSKEAAQFSIRTMINKGLIFKVPELRLRGGRKRVCYRLTEEGFRVFDPRGPLPVDREFEKVKPSEAWKLEIDDGVGIDFVLEKGIDKLLI